LSLNRAVKSADQNALTAADFIFAGVVHLLVIILAVILSWWQSTSEPKPLKHIEVEMISARELAKMQNQKPIIPQKKKKLKPRAKPVPKLEPQSKKQAKAVENDFDPFAPVQSRSDITTPKKALRNELLTIMGKQLSEQEVDRYIAMMQQAVQQHWKVSADVDNAILDPLVEMVLNRNGSVASARIIESSGNASLDQTLISAIYAAAPFRIPKQQFELFRTNRIRFRPLK